jgi:trehalose 6-phosphate phosphatase
VRAHALFLDLDGTLVDIAAHPDEVVAGGALQDLLRRLADAMDGALALITGRTIESADRILSGVVANIAGVHGFEQRRGGDLAREGDDLTPLAAAAGELRALVRSGSLNAHVEDKGSAVALHFRHAPDAAVTVRRLAQALAQRHGLTLLDGKMLVELTLGVRNKGDAVAAFMADAPFRDRVPIAVGDDLTDEDAFAAASAAGGAGVLVGEPRLSAAVYRLRDAASVSAWLEDGLR